MNTGSFYIGVGNRCAVDLESLDLPIPDQEAITILVEKGFKVQEVRLSALARELVGVSQYKRYCQAEDAPVYVDCSSLIKWLYGQAGIWLPRHPIDQHELGFPEVPWCAKSLQEGDLLFSTGRRSLYWQDQEKGVGHVGMVTENQTVIHAANSKVGVVEISLEEALSKWQERGAVRITRSKRTYTLKCPSNQRVEYSAAFRWKILAAISKPPKP